MDLLKDVVTRLANGEPLDPRHKDHPLSGEWSGHRECHIQPDWLLIYRYENDILVLALTRTGTHSDLFNLIEVLVSHFKRHIFCFIPYFK